MDTVHACDRRMDRITITKTVQRTASHGKNDISNKVTMTTSIQLIVLEPAERSYIMSNYTLTVAAITNIKTNICH